MDEIWLTGIGTVSPLGIGREAVENALENGESGIRDISLFEVGDYPIGTGGEIPDFQARKMVKNRKLLKVSRRNIHLALAAGNLGWEDAGLEGQVEPERAGVIMSAGRLGATLEEVCYAVRDAVNEEGNLSLERYAETSARLMPPYWFLRHIPNLVPGSVAIELDLKAPCNTICLNGVGSLVAIQESVAVIERGEADVMLAGGADCLVDPYHIVTHHQLGRLDLTHPEGPRPFEGDASGTLLGETGTVVVLERAEFARSRGKSPIAVWRGGCSGRPKHREQIGAGDFDWERTPDLTVLGGSGNQELDQAEYDLTDPESSLTCFRGQTGWFGGSNGVHDLACALISGKSSPALSSDRIAPSLSPDRWPPQTVGGGDLLQIQSLSWSGLFGAVRFELK